MISKTKFKIITCSVVLALFLLAFFAFTETTHAATLASSLRGFQGIRDLWKLLMNVVNSLVILILIVVAFAEILHININTYGVKKILPTLILAVVAANFSYLFARFLAGVVNVLFTFFTDPGLAMSGTPSTGGTDTIGKIGLSIQAAFPDKVWDNAKGGIGGGIAASIVSLFKLLFVILAAVLVFLLWLLWIVRNWVVQLLVVLSPVAIMAMVLPQTKSLFNQWWSYFWKWMFMPIPSLMFLWLGGRFMDTLSKGMYFPLLPSLLAVGCLYAALTVPFKLGGPIMAHWGNFLQAIPGNFQAFALRKAKNIEGVHGKGDARAKPWKKAANAVSFVNPKSFTAGVKDYFAQGTASRDKAVGKGKAYAKMAGRTKQAQIGYDKSIQDYRDLAADVLGDKYADTFGQLINTGRRAPTSKLGQIVGRMDREAVADTNGIARLQKDYSDQLGVRLTVAQAQNILAHRKLGEYFQGENPEVLGIITQGTHLSAEDGGDLKSLATAEAGVRSNDRKYRNMAELQRLYPGIPIPVSAVVASELGDAQELITEQIIENLVESGKAVATDYNPAASKGVHELESEIERRYGTIARKTLEEADSKIGHAMGLVRSLEIDRLDPGSTETAGLIRKKFDEHESLVKEALATLSTESEDSLNNAIETATKLGMPETGLEGSIREKRARVERFLARQEAASATLRDLYGSGIIKAGQTEADIKPIVTKTINQEASTHAAAQIYEQKIMSTMPQGLQLGQLSANDPRLNQLADSINELSGHISRIHELPNGSATTMNATQLREGLLAMVKSQTLTMGEIFKNPNTWKTLVSGLTESNKRNAEVILAKQSTVQTESKAGESSKEPAEEPTTQPASQENNQENK